MQLGFYFDQTRCTGCDACVVACKDWKDIPAGGGALLHIARLEQGRFPRPDLIFYPLACFHCAHPPCVEVCPTDALLKRARDGVVLVDAEACIQGCTLCLDACPYQAPQSVRDGTVMLCGMCADRREAGAAPICVAACPQWALDVGPLDELRDRYGAQARAGGFPEPGETAPSILFRPKKGAQTS